MRNFLSRQGDLATALGVLYLFGAVFCLGVVLLLVMRRHRLAIRSRSFPLVLLSCIGNLGEMTCTAVDGLMRESGEYEWILFYLTLFFEYVFFGPYLLRMYHLKVSYFDFLKDESLYWRQTKRLRSSWYLKVLFLGLIPYFLLPALLGILYFLQVFHHDVRTGLM